jgi:protein-S-isoprenylcysteine O-methyltransferase Ste14
MDETIYKETEKIKKGTIHFLLVHSYLMFLGAIILGVLFDTLLKEKIFSSNIYQWVGFFMLVFSSLVIFWAQKTSKNYKKNINKSENKSHFESGPYRYLRSPTHFGLFVMTLGFGLIINSLFTIVFTILGYTISKLVFLKKEERLLESKYGQVYSDYKKKVKNWI